MATEDAGVLARVGVALGRFAEQADLSLSPPALAQLLHRLIRQLTGVEDPYRAAKDRSNVLAAALLPEVRAAVEAAASPLAHAVGAAIAGNVIDLGARATFDEADVRLAVAQAATAALGLTFERFHDALARSRDVLYLADNAGELAFDGLLIERFLPRRVTLAVRGAPVLNDATEADARVLGLDRLAELIDNGSDAPGTLLDDCSRSFVRRFAAADLVVAKGQGNFESLVDVPREVFFLFKVKCPVIARRTGLPLGAEVLTTTRERRGS